MTPLHRMDQIGSLLRPPYLLALRSDLSSYSHSTSPSLKAAEKKAIREAINKQLELTIRPIMSGEYCRHIFYGGFFETLEGMTPIPDLPIPEAFRTDFPTTKGLAEMGHKIRAAVVAEGKIRWVRSAYLEEFEIMKSILKEEGQREEMLQEVKLTIPAPSYQHIQLKPGTAYTPSSGYTSDSAYFSDLAAAYASEINALFEAGCRNIQIDDPHLTYFCSSQFLQGCKVDGTDASQLLDLYLEAHNLFLRAVETLRRKGLHLGIHLCRGNMSGSKHWVEGSYDVIAEKLFKETDFDTYYLEFDHALSPAPSSSSSSSLSSSSRDSPFSCLQHLPPGKNVVLGLISTKTRILESKSELKAGVQEAAEWVAKGRGSPVAEAMDSLAISPQCGFSSLSVAGGKGMTWERMWEKLVLGKEVAGEVWGG